MVLHNEQPKSAPTRPAALRRGVGVRAARGGRGRRGHDGLRSAGVRGGSTRWLRELWMGVRAGVYVWRGGGGVNSKVVSPVVTQTLW